MALYSSSFLQHCVFPFNFTQLSLSLAFLPKVIVLYQPNRVSNVHPSANSRQSPVTSGSETHGQRSTIISNSTLVADEASLKPLEEKTFHTMIQPLPSPANPATDFELHQCIEAFYNGVWWKGVVTKVPERDGDLLYSVCFLTSREEFQFKASEIRRQMKWVKGECIKIQLKLYGTSSPVKFFSTKMNNLEVS